MINSNSLFKGVDFDKIPPIDKNIFWTFENDSTAVPITYFSNRSIAAIKNKNLTSVFIPSLSNLNLLEYNLFNTTNISDYISNIILFEYEPESILIDLNIDGHKHSNINFINADISIDQKLINSNLYLNIYDILTGYSDTIRLESSRLKTWREKFMIDKSGNFYIQVLSNLNGSTFKSNKKYLAISDFDIESEFLYQNKKSLHKFSNQNNAFYFDFKDLEKEINEIVIDEIIKVQQSTFNSLSIQYLWILLIFSLAAEWYLRKKNKLL